MSPIKRCPHGDGSFRRHNFFRGGGIKRGRVVGWSEEVCEGRQKVDERSNELFVFFFDGYFVDEGLQDGAHGFYREAAAEKVFREDARCFEDLFLGHWGHDFEAGVGQFDDFFEDCSTFGFELGEFVEQGLAATSIGDGSSGVGNLGREAFFVAFDGGEAVFAASFFVVCAVTLDFNHGGEAIGQEDVFAQGADDGIFEGAARDARCAAARFAFGA